MKLDLPARRRRRDQALEPATGQRDTMAMAMKEGLIGAQARHDAGLRRRREHRSRSPWSRPGPARSCGVRTKATHGYDALQLGFEAEEEERHQADGRASTRRPACPGRCGCCARCGCRRPRRWRLPGRADADGAISSARRARGRGGRDQGQGLPGRRQAPRLVRRRRHPRLDVPPGPRARSARRPIPPACGRAITLPGRMGGDRRTVLNLRGGARAPRAEPHPAAGRGARRDRRGSWWSARA